MSTQLAVNDIYQSVQGEGRWTGTPMVILRLQGCDVGCPWCDTKQTWQLAEQYSVNTLLEAISNDASWAWVSVETIAKHIAINYAHVRWVLVTGGEPAEQHLNELVRLLHEAGKLCAVETSGTALGHVGAGFDWVTVSPKIDMPGGRRVLELAVSAADEIKMVIGKEADFTKLDDLLSRVTLKSSVLISLQPVSQSAKATELCVNKAIQRGWNVSLQVHKYLEVR